MKTPTLTLQTTNMALSPGESAEFRCSITSHRPMTANFRLYRNGQSRQTETADKHTVTFILSSLTSSDQGSYSCDYYYEGTSTASSLKSSEIAISIGKLRFYSCMHLFLHLFLFAYSLTTFMESPTSDNYIACLQFLSLILYIWTHHSSYHVVRN